MKNEARARDELECQSRRFNLDISGLQQRADEDCKAIVAKVMSHIGSPHGIETVDVAHRKKSGALIVRFTTRTVRDDVYQRRFNLKGSKARDIEGFQGENNIYINESLTFERSRTMKDIRDRIKIIDPHRRQYTLRSDNGRIKLLTDGRSYFINSMADFEKLL